MRDALRGWLDQQEQLAGLLDPEVLRQQFQAAYDSLRPPLDGSPSIGSAACSSGRGSVLIPCWKPCVLRRPLTSRPSRSRPSTTKSPTTATMSMANAMAASAGARERGPCLTARALASRSEEHTSELQSRSDLVCRLLLEKKKNERSTALILFHASVRSPR